MKCSKCKREIPQGDTYVTLRSAVEVAGELLILDSVTVIVRCMNCLLYSQAQMHPCLEDQYEALRS